MKYIIILLLVSFGFSNDVQKLDIPDTLVFLDISNESRVLCKVMDTVTFATTIYESDIEFLNVNILYQEQEWFVGAKWMDNNTIFIERWTWQDDIQEFLIYTIKRTGTAIPRLRSTPLTKRTNRDVSGRIPRPTQFNLFTQ